MTSVQEQRAYYARTAEHYDSMHVHAEDEHSLALAAFAGMAKIRKPASLLDVGAGTGRGMQALRRLIPDAEIMGVEPVRELREVGYQRGLAPKDLVEGDATKLAFADDTFDFVACTGILHHIAEPALAVSEMVRVARTGIMISDSNKLGQGSRSTKLFKLLIYKLRLWTPFIYLQTRGRMSKWSEGDGLYFSYSIYDDIEIVRAKFPSVFIMNTAPMGRLSLLSGASHAMVVAWR